MYAVVAAAVKIAAATSSSNIASPPLRDPPRFGKEPGEQGAYPDGPGKRDQTL
jgi:hypothetical protein